MIAICDDERKDAEKLAELVKNTVEWKASRFPIRIFENPSDLINEIDKGESFSLIFMDIYLDEERGDLIGEKILRLDRKINLVFQTNSSDFAVRAFEMNALHYLVKPLTTEKIREVFRRFNKRNNRLGTMQVKDGKTDYILKKENITRIVSERKGVRIFQKDKEDIWIKKSFEKMASIIGEDMFLIVSRGYMVNMDFIQSMDGQKCILSNGTEILLSRKKRAEIRQRYHEYLFERA